jgi:hypothetical protein
MPRVIAITGADGTLRGVIRMHRIETADGTMEAVPIQKPDERQHVLDIPSDLLAKPVGELHEAIRRQLGGGAGPSS